MALNATQKNLVTASCIGISAITPAYPLACLAVIAQPIVAGTYFSKGKKLPGRLGQAALGFTLGFVGLTAGLIANPGIEAGDQFAKGHAAATEQVVEAPKVKPVVEAPAPKAEVKVAPAPKAEVKATPAPKAEVKATPAPKAEVKAAPAKKTYKYTAEEAKYQFSYFYNLGRSLGPGHMDTRYNAEQQLSSNGFPPVTPQFIKTVRECYANTGDAYCWDN